MNLIQEEIVHINGFPKKLVIFLHGYIDNAQKLESSLAPLINSLENTAIHIPEAPNLCEIHPKKRQWYSMHRFDPNDDRNTISSFDDYLKIYDKMKPGIIEAHDYIEPYIMERLNMYELEPKDLYLCGFSQGATLAIYTSLMMEEEIAGCISFSGIFAPPQYLAKNFRSTPGTLLIHSQDDNLVRFEALKFTKEELKKTGCKVKTCVTKKGQHRITVEGLEAALNFIK